MATAQVIQLSLLLTQVLPMADREWGIRGRIRAERRSRTTDQVPSQHKVDQLTVWGSLCYPKNSTNQSSHY